MEIKFLLRSVHIQDAAEWKDIGTPQEKWLVDEVAKVGEKTSFQPTIKIPIDKIKKGEMKKSITLIKDLCYHINAEILGGFGGSARAHLIVDCGFPFRIEILREGKDKGNYFWFKKGEFIAFDAELEAWFLDFLEGATVCIVYGQIKNRKKINVKSENEFDLILTIDNIEKKKLKFFDRYYSNNSIILNDEFDCFRMDY